MEDDYSVPHLPMDIMCQIPLLISDPATLVRLASSCKFFRDLIKKSTFLDHLRRRHRDHGFTPSLLLGFFYQDNKRSHSHLWQHHTDKNRCLAPSFVRTSELSQFVGSKAARNAVKPLSLETFIPGVGASLNFYKPIASQTASWLSAAASMAPMVRRWMCYAFATLSLEKPSNLPPNHYALFVTNNVDLYGRRSQSFFLIAIWIKNAKIFTSQCYSSKTGIWTASLQNPELMPGLYLVSSSAAASSSVVRWLCGSWKQWTLTRCHAAYWHDGTVIPGAPTRSNAKQGAIACKFSRWGAPVALCARLSDVAVEAQQCAWQRHQQLGAF
ncbi:uncharacterized protein LOC100839556 [Brachypodium distachyon]|uniref:F-box domain-containing protein n=1 Tax=Brachypodium distachyon TaxID=15368 RepID=A0A0Q3RGS6_BRADI|nr:uncharacterized protein LOC100839556 [Brachypodium distachyon]KQK12458.1 hypothetical protein BRADI_1g03867v3 [Brachypodium distachyon]|eukprot:XP_024312547.1 uncharacterized protein LOC100839556 [Brachypodium distachyon]